MRAHYRTPDYADYAQRIGELLARPTDVTIHVIERSYRPTCDLSMSDPAGLAPPPPRAVACRVAAYARRADQDISRARLEGHRRKVAVTATITLEGDRNDHGPLLVLLHGFPEVLVRLAEAGRTARAGPASASSRPICAATTCRRGRMASPTTPPTSWPPTSAASSASSVTSPRWWSVTTGAVRSRGPWR